MKQTEIFAIWGAVSGTIGTIVGLIGLWLRFRQHGLDKAQLRCDASFGFDSPNHHTHKLTIRSIGRRPVVVDTIRYYITPKSWKQRITKTWQHKKGRWIWNEDIKQKTKLNEGEKTIIGINVPNGINITDIYRVEVIDQIGKAWPVKWISHYKLEKIATQELLDEFKKENDHRKVNILGYRLGNKYFLQTSFNTKIQRTGVPCGRSFWFYDFKKYQDKLNDIKSIQLDEFLSGSIEEIK